MLEIAYDDRGFVPVVIQDWATGEVLTLAYANAEAVAKTQETGELHLWSRSRDELWHKGATSGNTQAVKALRVDCDGDALLALVEPAGPACHTGERTCFFTGELALAPHEVLPDLQRTLDQRAAERPDGLLRRAAARRPDARRREGPGGGRGGRRAPSREESDERVDERGRRRALPPHGVAAGPGPHARRRPGRCSVTAAR